jgi:hypothetical protein
MSLRPCLPALSTPLARCAVVLLLGLSLAGCLQKGGTSAAPPPDFTASAGEDRVSTRWTAEADVEYWLFGGNSPLLSADNWFSLPGAFSRRTIRPPYVVCGLASGTQLSVAVNGRRNEGPGGPFSTVATVTTRPGGQDWLANVAVGASDWNGVAERGGQVCATSPVQSGVNYVAVGTGGSIMTSPDARSWAAAAALPAGFVSNLSAVTSSGGASARWVAVGDLGATLVSLDGNTWTAGAAPTGGSPNLRAVASNGTSFVAVGDAGTIQTSTDGITWTARTSGVSANLRGVAFSTAGRFIAVGDAGTLLVSTDLVSWTPISTATGNALTAVVAGVFTLPSSGAAVFGVLVAGSGGSVLLSIDGGVSFAASAPGAILGVSGTTSFVAAAHAGRFLLIDAAGNAWGAVDGATWSGPFGPALAAPRAAVAADARYVVVGPTGSSSVSF